MKEPGMMTLECSRGRRWRRLAPLAIALLVAFIAQSGCALLPPPQTTIAGHIFGDPLLLATAAARITPVAPVPIAATVTCNGAAVSASADGAYSLAVDQTDQYTCTFSATDYVAITYTIASHAGSHVRLDLGAASSPSAATPTATAVGSGSTPTSSGCTAPIVTAVASCPPLRLKPGTISGVVTSADTAQPLAGASVDCWQPAMAAQPRSPTQNAHTQATGAFSISGMPAGPYACVAAGDATLYSGTLQPGGTATVVISACGRHCPPVTFHNGDVMHAMTAYLVFWLPPGQAFEPTGSDARFESLMAQYMSDIGGSALYGLLTQYWDYQGSVANSVTLGSSYVDTTPYPHAGTREDPISSDDIENELQQGIRAKNWQVDGEHEIFIFTGYNIESCAYYANGRDCSFGANGRHYCAYHSDFPVAGSTVNAIYAYLPVLSDCVQLDELSTSGSPNHDVLADSTINSLSHEHFESVTDPYGKGWYDLDPSSGEIGDKCEYRFGTIRADGGNVTLGHGHAYLLQEEWSDRAGGCALQ
jgi:hypothetical protein